VQHTIELYHETRYIYRIVGNNVNTRYKPEKFDRKLKPVNTQINTQSPSPVVSIEA